jgi:hypothetical protein
VNPPPLPTKAPMSIARDEEVGRWAIRRTLALEIIQGKASVSEEGVPIKRGPRSTLR